MNRLGDAVRRAVLAAAVLVLPVAAIASTTVPVVHTAEDQCCTGTPWGEIGQGQPPPPDM